MNVPAIWTTGHENDIIPIPFSMTRNKNHVPVSMNKICTLYYDKI